MSARRTSTSDATWLRWRAGWTIPGRFFRDLTGAMTYDGSFSLGVHRPHRYPSGATVLAVLAMLYIYIYDTIRGVLVIIFDDVRTQEMM